jgi:putative DNA primase/helicase
VIPFQHRVAKKKQNPKLGQQLIAEEAEGILAWAVAGVRDWLKNRLPLPASMMQQRHEWRKESDSMGQWLEENCVQQGNAKSASMDLYTSYKEWRVTHGLYEESMVVFVRKMKEVGFQKKEFGDKKVPHWLGVALVDRDAGKKWS